MIPERKTIRLAHSRYLGRNIYFLTFCCEDRRRIFGDENQTSSIVQTLKEISETHGFLVHAYCVMPDHAHVVVEGLGEESDVGRFVKMFKQVTAYRCKAYSGERMWQKKYYDHILRATDSLDAVSWYVWLNPVRAGLCADPRSYPYSGSFTIDWSGKKRGEADWTPPWREEKRRPT